MATAARIISAEIGHSSILKSEHLLLAVTRAGRAARLLMLNNDSAFLGQFVLDCLSVLSFVLVGYLVRLKISDIRKHRRMAARAERFGLIQDITATGTSIAQSSANIFAQQSVVTVVPGPDKIAKRWTRPASFPAAGFQWN